MNMDERFKELENLNDALESENKRLNAELDRETQERARLIVRTEQMNLTNKFNGRLHTKTVDHIRRDRKAKKYYRQLAIDLQSDLVKKIKEKNECESELDKVQIKYNNLQKKVAEQERYIKELVAQKNENLSLIQAYEVQINSTTEDLKNEQKSVADAYEEIRRYQSELNGRPHTVEEKKTLADKMLDEYLDKNKELRDEIDALQSQLEAAQRQNKDIRTDFVKMENDYIAQNNDLRIKLESAKGLYQSAIMHDGNIIDKRDDEVKKLEQDVLRLVRLLSESSVK